MDEAPLPFYQHDVVVLRPLNRDLLGGAGDEVGHDRIDGDAPSFDEDSRLSRRDEARAMAALHELVAQLQLRRHLADVAVGSHREDDQRIDFGGAAVGDPQIRRRGGRVGARMRTPRAAARGPSSGSSPMNVCSPLQISSFLFIAERSHAFHSSGKRPPAGAIPIKTAVAPLTPASKSPTTGILPPNPNTSWAVLPACWRSSTATIRSGK